jgi:hypothetical protein
VGKRVSGTTVEPLLDIAKGILYELLRPDPSVNIKTVVYEKPFGGLRVALRGDADVFGLGTSGGGGIAPGVSADVSTKQFGGGITVLYGNGVGFRFEGKVYPMEVSIVRPFAGLGATMFMPRVGPTVGLRGMAGAEARLGAVNIIADLAYERFLTDQPVLNPNSVLVGAGVGYLF